MSTAEFDTIYEYEFLVPSCELAEVHDLQSDLARDTLKRFIHSRKIQELIEQKDIEVGISAYQCRDIMVKIDLKSTMVNNHISYDEYRFRGYGRAQDIIRKWLFTSGSHVVIEPNDFIDFKLDLLTTIFDGYRCYFSDIHKIITGTDVRHFESVVQQKLDTNSTDWRLTPQELHL